MNDNGLPWKRPWLTPAAYILILVSLLLPFCHFKCGGMKLATVQGTDMIIGGEISLSGQLKNLTNGLGGSKMSDEVKDKDRNSKINIWVIIMTAAAVGGLIFHFLKVQPQQKIQLIIALAGIAALLVFVFTRNQFFELSDLGRDKEDPEDREFGGAGILSIGLGIGFWLSLLGFAANVFLHFKSPPQQHAKEDIPDVLPPAEETPPQVNS